MKTEELENKMTELENTKQSLAEEINNMSGSTTSTTTTESTEEVAAKSNDTASTEADLSTACLSILENGSTSQSGEKTFTTIVTTSYNKATSLSAQLDKNECDAGSDRCFLCRCGNKCNRNTGAVQQRTYGLSTGRICDFHRIQS